MNILPKPKETAYLKGNYSGNSKFTVENGIYEKFNVAFTTCNASVSASEEGKENIVFFEIPSFGKEEYELVVSCDKIEIFYTTDEGAFRAISTLSQIIRKVDTEEIPCMRIHDLPDIPVRGIMLTLTQNRVPLLNKLFELVDRLAAMKYNMLQLYFDTFVFEYDSFRKYLDGKAYMTQEEIHLLDDYCKERHIELMANQELFGHMAAWLSQDEFRPLAIVPDAENPTTMDPLLDETFEHVKKILDDLLPHFSSPIVHIGMDEPHDIGKGATKEPCETFGYGEIIGEYIAKVSKYIKEKYNKRSMFWGDFVAKYPESLNYLPKDTIFVDWGYEPLHKFDRNILLAKNAGLQVYVAPGTHGWCTFSGRTDVMIQNIFDSAEAARFHGVEGFLLTDWGDIDFPDNTLLAFAVGAAFSWNAGYNMSIAESGNEDNCRYRNEIIHCALQYLDEVVFCSTGKVSFAEIIYKLGNYYILEQPDSAATWNGTMLYKHTIQRHIAKGELTTDTLSDIIEYTQKLKNKLDRCVLDREDSDLLIEEIKLIMDTIIAAANALGIRNSDEETPEKFEMPNVSKLIERRKANWSLNNKLSESSRATIPVIYESIETVAKQ